jgi:hypothetical protein
MMRCIIVSVAILVLSAVVAESVVPTLPVEVENQCDTGVFLHCGDVDVNHSAAIVRSVPVTHYFDTLGGQYRFGILGDNVKSIFPELTMDIEKTYVKKDKSTTTVPLTVLDSNLIFMHTLVEIQRAIDHVAKVDVDIRMSGGEVNELTERLQALLDKFALNEGFESIADVIEKNLLTRADIESVDDEISHIKDMTSAAISVSKHRLRTRKENLAAADIRLVQLLNSHFDVLRNISRQKLLEIDVLLSDDIQSQYDVEIRQLERNIELELAGLKEEINTAIKKARFRIEEETEVERRNEDVYVHILHAKEDSRRKASNEMIVVFFQEVNRYMTVILDNPKSLLLWSSNMLIAVTLFIVIVEVIKESRNILLNKFTPPFGVNFVRGKKALGRRTFQRLQLVPADDVHEQHNRSPSLHTSRFTYVGNDAGLEQLVLPDEVKTMILRITATMNASTLALGSPTIAARWLRTLLVPFDRHGLCSNQETYMPNTIIRGPGGTGKSMVAKAIAEASGLPYAILSGADLEAHGTRASAYLRTILDRLEAQSVHNRCVLIIDDPDEITDGALARQHMPTMRRYEQNSEDCDAMSITSSIDDDGAKGLPGTVDGGCGGGISYCLYVLLQAIRQNSKKFCLIITSSQELHLIDSALLDR